MLTRQPRENSKSPKTTIQISLEIEVADKQLALQELSRALESHNNYEKHSTIVMTAESVNQVKREFAQELLDSLAS